MEKQVEYQIPISGLSIGKHDFRYEIDGGFFSDFEYSEVREGNVEVRLSIDRRETMLDLHFDIGGWVLLPCDRCADEFQQPIENGYDFFVKLGSEYVEESDDVVIIPAEQPNFDVKSLIYEFIILSLPIHRLHPEGGCNPEVLKFLDEQTEFESVEEDTDPRWQALKELKVEDDNNTGN